MQRQVHASTRPWDRLLCFVLVQAETSCVSRRLLDRSGYTITSTIALHHEHAAMIISLGRSVRCGANLERCSRLRNIRRSRLVLPRLFRHGVELSLKLSCTRNGLVLDEIHPIPLHEQHDQTGVANNVIYDTAPSSRNSARIGQAMLSWLRVHGVGLSLK